jgi:hypothetical protein
VAVDGLTLIETLLVTTTVAIAVSEQPLVVPVTVYEILESGVAVTVAALVLLSAVAGIQE